MSAASAESIESSDDEDEEEIGSARVRKKPAKKVAESEESEPVDADEADQTPRRRTHHRRKNSETDSNLVDTKPVADSNAEAGTPSTPVRRGRRRAITAPEATLPDAAVVKKEPEDEEKVASISSADLNASSGNITILKFLQSYSFLSSRCVKRSGHGEQRCSFGAQVTHRHYSNVKSQTHRLPCATDVAANSRCFWVLRE